MDDFKGTDDRGWEMPLKGEKKRMRIAREDGGYETISSRYIIGTLDSMIFIEDRSIDSTRAIYLLHSRYI